MRTTSAPCPPTRRPPTPTLRRGATSAFRATGSCRDTARRSTSTRATNTPRSIPRRRTCPRRFRQGVYRRTFTVPEAWAGRRIYLTIGGAKSGVYVYVNGREAGYNEDSKNPAQYRIDPLLRPGENTLALKMTRWSTGSYLEAQDFWRISGIERTVYLSAETPDALRDFEVVSTLDDSYRTGLFTLKMFLAGDREVEAGYELLDPEGRTVASGRQQATGEALFRAEIPDAAHWTAETPTATGS